VGGSFGDVALFVDANADYRRSDFEVFQALDDFGLMMFEQPLPKEDLEGAAPLQKQVRTPICLDEGIGTADDARRAIALGSRRTGSCLPPGTQLSHRCRGEPPLVC